MTPRNLNLYCARFDFSGNSGYPSTSSDVCDYLLNLAGKLRDDSRVGAINIKRFCETPADYARNMAVSYARQVNADVLLMLDSDSAPDINVGKDPWAVPFWDAAFGFLYKHYEQGPIVVGAPYCSGPPHETVFVKRWKNSETDSPEPGFKLGHYEREEAAQLVGIQEAAALPTGLILFDMRCFDLTEPKQAGDRPWFYYEYGDVSCTRKVSSEDITATRDISMMGIEKLGYNPVFCAWSSWCGHWKPKCVGKPRVLGADAVQQKFARAIRDGHLPGNLRRAEVNCGGNGQGVPIPG